MDTNDKKIIYNQVNLPEISAKTYAKINKLTLPIVNQMCSNGVLVARKINSKGVCIDNLERGYWWINLVQLTEELKK
ncbi:MAG: hypothetical protein ABGY11_06815 [Candidatus Thioglobus sp.]|jgi:hypothetical protein